MWARRVTPAAVVVRQSVIRRAEVGGGDEDGGAAGIARFIVRTLDFKAGSAAQAAIEERSA